MEYEIDEIQYWLPEESMLAPQLNPFGRRPDVHRADDEVLDMYGRMHHFAEAFQASPRSNDETQVW